MTVNSARARAAAAAALRAADWLAGALFAFGFVLLLEGLRRRGGAAPLAGEIAYLGRLAALCALYFSALPGLLLGLRFALARRVRSSARMTAILALVVAGLALGPALAQAEFLASGPGAVALGHPLLLRAALCAALVLGAVALFLFHWSCLRPAGAGRSLAMSGLGLLALGGLWYALRFELDAYAYFAFWLLPPTWLVAASLGFLVQRALRRRWPPLADGLLALAALITALGTFVPEPLARARSAHVRQGKIVALSDRWVHAADARYAQLTGPHPRPEACAPPAPVPVPTPLALPREQRRNVILISVDALRADALEFRDPNGARVMPALAAFAAESLRYTRAVTTYPATLLAMGGALTGWNASQLLFSPDLPPNVFALAGDRFERRLVSLPRSHWFRKPIATRLFVQNARARLHADAAQQTDWLLEQLRDARRKRERVLAWVHYFEPHQKYERHPGFDFGRGARAQYTSELAYLDQALGRLFAGLERDGYLADSLVIVFADHGEALGELDYLGHHVYLNSWIADIPLLVRAPGLRRGISTELADITDVAASVLHFADLPPPPESAGISLLAESGRAGRVSVAEAFPVRGDELFALTDTPIRSVADYEARMRRIHRGAKNYQPKVSAVSADYRLIVNRENGLEEFYDRRTDRAERHDLSFERRPEQQRLREQLGAWSRKQQRLLYCKARALEAPGAAPAPRRP